MAGYTSRAGNTLFADYLLLAEKLKRLGFVMANGRVVIVEPDREVKNV